jgi:ABC-type Fe3+ transport system permease subunit
MPLQESITAALLIVLILGIVAFFSWQEVQNLRRLRGDKLASLDDAKRIRYRAARRLFCCLLMLVLAGLLMGNYFIDRSREVILEPDDGSGAMSDDQRAFTQFYSAYWIAILLLLLLVILIVGYDLWSLRRWGLREQLRLHQEHRERLEHDVSQYLRQRNGHKG